MRNLPVSALFLGALVATAPAAAQSMGAGAAGSWLLHDELAPAAGASVWFDVPGSTVRVRVDRLFGSENSRESIFHMEDAPVEDTHLHLRMTNVYAGVEVPSSRWGVRLAVIPQVGASFLRSVRTGRDTGDASGFDRNLLMAVVDVQAYQPLGSRLALSVGVHAGGAFDTADRSFAPSPGASAGQELNAALVGAEVGLSYRF